MNKEDLRKLVKKYFYGDKYEWFGFENEGFVRYDKDSSKICYSLIRYFKPQNCFEVGTSMGHSTIFITDALLKNEKPFEFTSVEREPDLFKKAQSHLRQRHKVLFPHLILGDVAVDNILTYVPEELDFAFIDTDHDKESTEWYIQNIFPRLKRGALVAIHDFAVEEIDGKWVGKGQNGTGGLEETQLLMDLHKEGKLPLKPLYWNYKNPLFEDDNFFWEASFWTYEKDN